MRFYPLFLLSAFLATAVTGQTLTYTFPATGSYELADFDYYAVCVKGAKWADVTTDNPDYSYDISTTSFESGDRLDVGRASVDVPDSYESCKGGMLFQTDRVINGPNLVLTLKATLADDASSLTVCGFYNSIYPGPWPDSLPTLGFTNAVGVFSKKKGLNHNANLPDATMNTLCRDFSPTVTGDESFFSEALPLPPTFSYTFPATGLTTYPENKRNSLEDDPDANMYYGICIKDAQFASTTNSFAGYPDYKMVSRHMYNLINLWNEPSWWETPTRPTSTLPHWTAHYVQHFPIGNTFCEGGVYLQPQESYVNTYYDMDQRIDRGPEELTKRAENRVTVDIVPKNNGADYIKICALVTAYHQRTPDFWAILEAEGFVETHLSSVAWYRTKYFCKDIRRTTMVTMKLSL